MSELGAEIEKPLEAARLDAPDRADIHADIQRRLRPVHDGTVVVLEIDGSDALQTKDGSPWSISDLVADIIAAKAREKAASAPAAPPDPRKNLTAYIRWLKEQPRKPLEFKGPNPWAPASVNFTQQAIITRSDPVLAARMMKEARK